jgi:inner membrane protein
LDSLTQIVLGASVAGVCVPQPVKRKAAVIGAILGTVPDLDVFIDYGDAVANFTYHRGFSHSLLVLLPLSLVLWTLLKRWYRPVQDAPIPWLLAISLALLTHPLLDAHTAYGTQLFWPLSSPPVSWSTIFIIDPLYTLPLLIGTVLILIKPTKAWANKVLCVGLIISSSYLGWTWLAKFSVDSHVLASLDTQKAKLFTTPTPFNSLLWRVVVLQEDQYLEGFYSLLNPDRSIQFKSFDLNKELLLQTQHLNAVSRLQWFTQGFLAGAIVDNQIVISDLRMGFTENYVFSHAVAKVEDPHFYEMESVLLPFQFKPDALSFVWETLTKSP